MFSKKGFVAGDWLPLLWAMGLLMFFGVFIPLILQDFSDFLVPTDSSIFYPLANIVANGISMDIPFLGAFSFNVLDFFPTTVHDSLTSYTVGLTYIPNILAIPLCVVIIYGFVWGIRKFISAI